MGCGGAVCFASGYAEAGEEELQNALVTAAGDMPLLGPNCYGVLNYLDGAMLWPDQHGGRAVDSGVAIISQSSNIAINLSMQARGLPMAYVACVGNQAQTSLADMARSLLADPRVTAAGLYIEGIVDAADFAAMADEAMAAGKPVVAIKAGRTAAAQAAASSHTAALAGDGAASSAVTASRLSRSSPSHTAAIAEAAIAEAEPSRARLPPVVALAFWRGLASMTASGTWTSSRGVSCSIVRPPTMKWLGASRCVPVPPLSV